ncbi:MAG: hypothetical protein HYX41_02575 [Bdellovibrio sp.]|nr:hypothetical protein [Bdellovibrio sp.]
MTKGLWSAPGFLVVLCLASCTQVSSVPPSGRLPLPSKDEVALVNGVPLTLVDFLDIRSIAPKLTPEKALWAGMASIALTSEAAQKKISLNKTQALTIARYALQDLDEGQAKPQFYTLFPETSSPSLVHQTLDDLLARSVVIKSSVNLSKLF